MAYPRQCEGCGTQYATFAEHAGVSHATVCATDGGTPSPWVPSKPGRVLDIGCRLCGAVVRWDYFGASQGHRLGRSLGLVTQPRPNWQISQPADARARLERERGGRLAS
ncbi:MAG: hypothetical protein IT307_19715 [Chloroflexi bacterium]|nr:hypothetical protein [Chloroflexota bacterium]